MKLLTEVSIPEYPFRLDHHSPVLMMGSCFTENIGRLLERSRFPLSINPFGVTYNPVSVHRQLEALMDKKQYRDEDLDQHGGLWFSFDHYTGFSSPDREACLQGINQSFEESKAVLQKAKLLVITWGTAWIYRHNETGQVVCNCHKIPAAQFTRSRLSVREIISHYNALLPRLFKLNPELKILLTVSPIRHWKDQAHGNQLSKASLLLATEALEEQYPAQVFYFPSYEIAMDELRDYRFYTEDMLHLNSQATRYIWEKFRKTLVSDESNRIIDELEPLLKMEEHRSRNLEGEAFKNTLRKQEDKRQQLQGKYPFLKL
jgi:hypothetical protein